MNAVNIIEKIGNGNLSEAARKLQVPIKTLHNWKLNNNIPNWRQDNIKRVADRMGVKLED